jgi:hypothetical protein
MELGDDVFHLRVIFEGVDAHFPTKGNNKIKDFFITRGEVF